MHTQITQTVQESKLLRQALRGNGVFSAISGLTLIIAVRPIAAFMGLAWPLALTITGLVLLPYAAVLFWATSQAEIDPRLAKTAVVLDGLWVIGSILLLLTDWLNLSVAGNWTVALLAEAVLTFAILQALGLRRARSQ
jgi:hypothetical protein